MYVGLGTFFHDFFSAAFDDESKPLAVIVLWLIHNTLLSLLVSIAQIFQLSLRFGLMYVLICVHYYLMGPDYLSLMMMMMMMMITHWKIT